MIIGLFDKLFLKIMRIITIAITIFIISSCASRRVENSPIIDSFVSLAKYSTPIHLLYVDNLKHKESWPLVKYVSVVSKKELDCIRGEYSKESIGVFLDSRYRHYAAKNYSRLGSDIEVLKSGLANISREYFLEWSKEDFDVDKMTLIMSGRNQKDSHLHELLFIEGYPWPKDSVINMSNMLFLGALSTCHVDKERLKNI